MLQVLTIYAVSALSLFVGIGLGSDVERWFKERKQAPKRVARGLGGGHV